MSGVGNWGYVIVGFCSGIISGMGIGGGAILIPALGFLFAMDQRAAQNINLLYFIPTAIVALVTHKNKGNIEKKGLLRLMLFGLCGAAIGSVVALQMDSGILRKGFGVFLLGMGVYEMLMKEKKETKEMKAWN